MKALNGQVKQYTKSGEAPSRSAALGECAVGITFLHNGIRLMKQGYTNIHLSVPKDGTSYEVGSVAMIKGAPEAEAAKMFIDWCMTPACLEIGQKYTDSYHFLTNPDAHTNTVKITIACFIILYVFCCAFILPTSFYRRASS